MDLATGVVLFVAGVAVLFVAIRGLARVLFGRQRRLEASFGDEVLRQRLAAGEISKAQYDAAREALGL